MFGDVTKRAAFVAIAAVGFGSPAIAQMQCGGYADTLAAYSEKHGESIVTRGLDAGGNAMVILGNPDTGTWTLLVVYPNGTACLVAYGDALELHKPKPNA